MASPNAAYLQSDVQIGLSVAPESAVNTPYALTGEFEGILVDQFNPPTPDFETIDDSDQVGDGTEFAKNIRNYYLQQPSFPLSGKLNTESAARFLKRFLAGDTDDNLVATGVYDHDIIMQTRSEGIIPQLSTLAVLLGGNDFIWASLAVDSFSISQQLAGEPRFQTQLIGTGYHKRFRDNYRVQTVTITGTPVGGTFKLTFDGIQTGTIAFDAAAAAVLSALEALANIAPGDVTVTGGPGPGTPWVVTFLTTGAYANAEVPLMTADGALLTGGTSPAAAVTPSVAYLAIAQPPDYHYMHGAALLAVMNDGSVRDLTADGLLSYEIQMSQNIQVLRLPGNSFIVPSDFSSGAYPDFIRRGKRTATANVKLFLDADMPEYYYRRKNLDISSFIITNRGERIGSTAYHHEFEITIPFSKVMSMSADAEGDMAAKSFSLMPTKDPVSLGIVTARVRNSSATLL